MADRRRWHLYRRTKKPPTRSGWAATVVAVSALEALLARIEEEIELGTGQQERPSGEGGGRERARPKL
jgi:hypothetical protein